MHMRCRIAILMLTGMLAGVETNGQGMPHAGPSAETIQRHWPDDGSQNPSTATVNWGGRDAVGLQFRDHDAPESNLVPVSMLKIPSQALKEMQKSDKALLAGDVKGSAEHLAKMLELTPDFALGHNSLGARYVVLGEYDKAIEEFQRAVTLQPKYRLAMDNIVVAMCAQHRYAEAEPVARWALQTQPEAASSRYLLGSILVSENKPNEEALKLLRSVQDKYPRARMFLASWLILRGEKQQAAEELREYLRSPLANDNGVAREWLAQLEKELSVAQSDGVKTHE
jgi:tetratricopeptide (TPR) repeat protein